MTTLLQQLDEERVRAMRERDELHHLLIAIDAQLRAKGGWCPICHYDLDRHAAVCAYAEALRLKPVRP